MKRFRHPASNEHQVNTESRFLALIDTSLRENYRRRLDGVAYATYILIMVVVPLKIFCRKKAGGWSNVRWDDFMSLVSLALANGFFFVCIIGMFPMPNLICQS